MFAYPYFLHWSFSASLIEIFCNLVISTPSQAIVFIATLVANGVALVITLPPTILMNTTNLTTSFNNTFLQRPSMHQLSSRRLTDIRTSLTPSSTNVRDPCTYMAWATSPAPNSTATRTVKATSNARLSWIALGPRLKMQWLTGIKKTFDFVNSGEPGLAETVLCI